MQVHLRGAFEILETLEGVKVVCEQHTDIMRVIQQAPQGECTVANTRKERLVADTDNILTGLEHFFGVNALGTHP